MLTSLNRINLMLLSAFRAVKLALPEMALIILRETRPRVGSKGRRPGMINLTARRAAEPPASPKLYQVLRMIPHLPHIEVMNSVGSAWRNNS